MAHQHAVDMTTGKPYRGIIRFALPILAGSLFQQLYNMADTFIVSRTLGVEAFAGVSSTGSISGLITGFALGMTSVLFIVPAQSFGAGEAGRQVSILMCRLANCCTRFQHCLIGHSNYDRV